MEQNPSWEANTSSDNQEMSRKLRHPEVHYRIHKSTPPPHVPNFNQSNPFNVPHPTYGRFILILRSHLRLVLPSGPTCSSFSQQNPVRTSPFPHTYHMSRPSILLYLVTRIVFGAEETSLSSSLCGILHSPVTFSLLEPNILLSTLFSDTLSLCSSLDVTDQDSHPYKTTGNITVMCILISVFLDSKLQDKRSCTKC